MNVSGKTHIDIIPNIDGMALMASGCMPVLSDIFSMTGVKQLDNLAIHTINPEASPLMPLGNNSAM